MRAEKLERLWYGGHGARRGADVRPEGLKRVPLDTGCFVASDALHEHLELFLEFGVLL